MSDEEQYLRKLGYPGDEWILNSGQQWFRAVEVGEGLGLSHDSITTPAEGGAFPGAVIHYLYQQRKQTEDRREERNTTA